MSRKKKTILGQTNSAPAQRQFTDREEPQESFVKSLAEVNNKEYSILTYYGVGGIGKSSLQRHLKSEHLDKSEENVYSWIDFELEANRTPHKALRIIAKNFKSMFKIKFTAFDIAYVIYWSKAFPDHDIKKDGLPFLEAGSQLSSILNLFEDVGGMIGTALGLVDYLTKKGQEFSFNMDIQIALKELNTLELDKIEEKLGIFFAHDIDIYKKKNPNKKIVIFLDTYEALWQSNRNDANRLSQDEWIRDFVTELPNVLFVICGREKIRWAEIDSDWEEDLNQHILGNLSTEDAKSFLDSCDIKDKSIQYEMIESSEGLPYYLDLCVDTFFRIKDCGEVPSAKDFSQVGKEKIFERFMRYLSTHEQETLKVLANARFYTKELFSLLVEEFKTGYPITAMHQLNNFSFISEDDGKFFIHDLMRKSLIFSQNEEICTSVNDFLFNHYNIYLQNLDIKSIPQESIEALPEAFYHKEQIKNVNINDLLVWFEDYYYIFFNAAKYQILLEKIKYILETYVNEISDNFNNNSILHFKLGTL